MLILSLKPGHDGSAAAIEDGRLLFSVESEKDSFARYTTLQPNTFFDIAERLGKLPDVVALSGWQARQDGKPQRVRSLFGAGYFGSGAVLSEEATFFGKKVQWFSSSHERSHILGAIGMAPKTPGRQVVLVWEGVTGSFYLIGKDFQIEKEIPVLSQPGSRYSSLFAICDPSFPDQGAYARLNDSGKLMALAAFADPRKVDDDISDAVDNLLSLEHLGPVPKHLFRDTPLHNCGVESTACKSAAAALTERIFRRFADVALNSIPKGLPLRISGGCGLNCDWNENWRTLGHFSDVFVAPCTNDSGSAIGTAIDAALAFTGDPYIDWSVYSGLEFVTDTTPDESRWSRRPYSESDLAESLAQGRVAAWVQGRWEIGPRALGNRSLLAEPFKIETRDKLNTIKQRESYRPIAPCVRIEDVGLAFEQDFEDPYMLFFRRVRDLSLRAVTHVDGSARAQTVSAESNTKLHQLLTSFGRRTGVGVLCNTSLNFNGHGFINRMSHLVEYCEERGIADMVVGAAWYTRRR